MRIQKLFLFIFCFSIPHFLSARENFSDKDSIRFARFSNFDLDFFAGVGGNTSGGSLESIRANLLYHNWILSTRFFRSEGLTGYFFEDAVGVGRKFNLGRQFNFNLTTGYSDLAFERSVHTLPEISRENFHKTQGIFFQSELGYTLSRRGNKFSPLGFSIMSYYIVNPYRNIFGYALGIDFSPTALFNPRDLPLGKHEKISKPPYENKTDGPPCRNIISFSLTGMFHEPHITYERVHNAQTGFYLSAAYRLGDFGPFLALISLYENPDFSLAGPCVYVGKNWYKAKKYGFNAIGIRTGCRYLFKQNYWVGTGSDYDPAWVISRYRRDIPIQLHLEKVSFSKNGHLELSMFLNAGIRVSDYTTYFYFLYFPGPVPGIDYGFHWPKNGTYIRPDFNCGVELGFGW
jgi:hypothetical protein